MSTKKFVCKLLGLQDLKLKHFILKTKLKELYLWVKPLKNGCKCPICGRRGTIVKKKIRTRDMRNWKDIVVCGYQVFLLYAPKEIICPTHGRIQEDIPWADVGAKITSRVEYRALVYSKLTTQKAASMLLNIPKSTLSDIIHRAINRIRKDHRIRGVDTIGVDEISYQKGRKFITIVYDLKKGTVLWVGKGKGRKTIDTFFNEKLSDFQKKTSNGQVAI